MQELTISIPAPESGCQDLAKVLSMGLTEIGSLRASRQAWAEVLGALGLPVKLYLRESLKGLSLEEAAFAVVDEAIPPEEVGEIHPQQATVQIVGPECVEFETPGNVLVMLSVGCDNVTRDETLVIHIDFRRDSKHLATIVLADLLRTGVNTAELLAQAANELANAV